jgi:hypothetical protein
VKIVIVGAGFAGLDCAKALAGSPAEGTIVDRNNFHTFLPLLYQVATSGLASADVSYPLRGILHDAPNVAFRQATVTGVDWAAGQLLLAGADPLPFDRLVVAAGAVASYFGIPGAAEHAFPLYDLSDSIRLPRAGHRARCSRSSPPSPSSPDGMWGGCSPRRRQPERQPERPPEKPPATRPWRSASAIAGRWRPSAGGRPSPTCRCGSG